MRPHLRSLIISALLTTCGPLACPRPEPEGALAGASSGIPRVIFGNSRRSAGPSPEATALAAALRARTAPIFRQALADAVAARGDGAQANVVASPLATGAVSAMLALGGTAATRAALAAAFGWPSDRGALAAAWADLLGVLAAEAASSPETTLASASRIFLAAGSPVDASFDRGLATAFAAPPFPLDFAGAPAGEQKRIELWASEQAGSKMAGVLLPGAITSATQLAAVGGLRLQAPWPVAFYKDPGPALVFHPPVGDSVATSGLRATTELAVERTADEVAIRLPVRGGAFTLVLVLPTLPLSSYVAGLDAAVLGRLAAGAGATTEAVRLIMPAFTLRSRQALLPALAAAGLAHPEGCAIVPFAAGEEVPLAAAPAATLAGLSVDIDGCDAHPQGVTTAQTPLVPPPTETPTVFTLDHAFLVLLVDDALGAVLLIGQVQDPNAS